MDFATATPDQIEAAIENVVGSTEEESGEDYYDDYTGLNGFYHILAGTGGYSNNHVDGISNVTANGEIVELKGVGRFRRISAFEANFDTYEKSWDNFLVFEFNGRTFRKEGYLDSYQGGVWDGRLEEVKPVEKTITVWETI